MTFEKVIGHVLAMEGGYVFDSHDPGGETNFGISKRQYPNVDIKNLTKAEAVNIYFQDYWQPLPMLQVPERLRLCLFDCAVNQGVPRAIRILQGAVGVKQDGVLGPQTVNALQTYDSFAALFNMVNLRLKHYGKLPHFNVYGEGWAKRLIFITFESLK